MGGERRGEKRVHAGMAIAGAVLMLGGLPLPWIAAGLGIPEPPARGVDLAAIAVPITLTALAVIAFTVVSWRFQRDQLFTYAALASGFLLVYALAMLIAIESASGLIPASFLPVTLRRSSGILTAGAGLWVSLAGATISAVAASPVGSWLSQLHSWHDSRGRRMVGAVVLLLVLTIFVGWLRYQPWVNTSMLGQGFGLSGQSAPWIGPASLFAVCLLAGAIVLAGLSRFQAAGLVAAGGGWLISFLAAISLIAAESMARLRLGDLVDSASGQSVTFQAAPAALGTYVSGLLIAGVGGFLVWWQYESGGD